MWIFFLFFFWRGTMQRGPSRPKHVGKWQKGERARKGAPTLSMNLHKSQPNSKAMHAQERPREQN